MNDPDLIQATIDLMEQGARNRLTPLFASPENLAGVMRNMAISLLNTANNLEGIMQMSGAIVYVEPPVLLSVCVHHMNLGRKLLGRERYDALIVTAQEKQQELARNNNGLAYQVHNHAVRAADHR